MVTDLHNHTTRCNHATGTMQAYVQKAIANKTQFFGFSDHAPMAFDEAYRMGFDELEGYFDEITQLQHAFRNQITILKALEVDYLPGYMDERVLHADVDYLIGSVHFLKGWGFDNPEYIREYEKKDINEIWEDYFHTIIQMCQSSLFDIVGHIDLIKVFKFYPTKDMTPLFNETLSAIKETDMVLELNMAGLRKKCQEMYPSFELLKMANALEVDITFASDAHKPDDVGYASSKLIEAAKAAGYKKCATFRNREKELIKF